MLNKFVKFVVLTVFLILLQVGFLPALSVERWGPNIVLTWLVFCALTYDLKIACCYGLAVGGILEMYSILPFGLQIGSLLVSLLLSWKLFQRLFTNKSLYSLLAVLGTATLIYWLLQLLIVMFAGNLLLSPWESLSVFWQAQRWRLVTELFFNSLIALTMFVFWHLASNRFQAAFVDTTKT